ncbi:hypothetical protein TRFO_39745 [Tritrichomonas foetus]|uniref:Uncharacterized protein n=1 Tax=Tritrichomonas foetus TaxID=1144522 RepID=A0A1J4J9G1_9EUKA|nr:hypothetical protein TRFO_39745 [Tritrichomonas foetus]|eukprot:OHS94061.1 hypothetical protein TRFO_39745 [Tritrichomonas foetus]
MAESTVFIDKIRNVCFLQEVLDNFNEETVSKIDDFLHDENMEKSQLSQFFRALNASAICRPHNIQIYIGILETYIDKLKFFFNKSEIISLFRHDILLLALYKYDLLDLSFLIPRWRFRVESFYFFYPEIECNCKFPFQDLLHCHQDSKYEKQLHLKDYQDKRFKNYHHSTICKFIVEDDIENFQSFISETNFSLDSILPKSIFERFPHFLKNEFSLIEYAAFHSSLKIFKFLWMQQITNFSSFDDLLALSIAGGNLEIFHLVEAEVRKLNTNLNTFNVDNNENLKMFLNLPFKQICLLLKLAIYYHQNEIACYIIDNSDVDATFIDEGDVNHQRYNILNYLFHYCMKNYNVTFLKYLLENYNISDILSNVRTRTPLIYACKYGHSDIVSILLYDLNVDVNAFEDYDESIYYPLHYTTKYSHFEVLETLIKHKSIYYNPIDEDGVTPFLDCCRRCDFLIFRFFMDNLDKFDPQIISSTECNGLHYASLAHNIDIINYFISHQFYDINARDSQGWTAVLCGCEEDYPNQLEIFVNANADLNIPNHRGMTCFMKCVLYKCSNSLNYLLSLPSIDFNTVNSDGDTIFHSVMKYSVDMSLIKYLLENYSSRFNLNIEDKEGVFFNYSSYYFRLCQRKKS